MTGLQKQVWSSLMFHGFVTQFAMQHHRTVNTSEMYSTIQHSVSTMLPISQLDCTILLAFDRIGRSL